MDLAELLDRQHRAAVLATRVWMDEVVAQGQTELAPILEGTLRGTGNVEIVDAVTGSQLGGPGYPARVDVLGYFSTPYAQRQHESFTVGEYMDGNTKRPEDSVSHPRGGGPKFLETPFKAALPHLEARVARAVAAVTP